VTRCSGSGYELLTAFRGDPVETVWSGDFPVVTVLDKSGGKNMSNDVPEKFRKYVVTELPKYVEVAGHHKPAPFWLAPGMFPGVNVRVAGLDVSKIVGAPHADAHVHDGPEIYLAPSEDKGNLVVEVEMDGQKFSVEAPFAVFIPPGVRHCFRVVKCEKPHYVLGIMLTDWQEPKP
jgi:quercetin dioxygenase-like cupin family protein